MKIKFVGITGGSGVGKSTLCRGLEKKYPDKIGILRLDDYFKPAEEKPKMGEIRNSDHPDALYLEKLADDMERLGQGEEINIYTKDEEINPDYQKTKTKIPLKISPKEIILVEGFLLLYSERIRKLLETSIFLEASHEMRWERRVHLANKNKEYEEKVIIPMHNAFVEPMKKYAEHVIDVSDLSREHVLEKVEEIIFNKL